MDPPGWVCQLSGGLFAARRVASTTCTLLPPSPATAPLTVSTPGALCLKLSKITSRAARSEPDVHQEMTSSLFPGLALAGGVDPPPQPARSSRTPAVPAPPALRGGAPMLLPPPA